VLSPATNSSCHRHPRIKGLSKPGRADLASANLTPATGARTTRLCRPQLSSFVCAPFDRSQAFRQPALRSRHAPNAAASTASHPASVTIAIRPSGGRDGEAYRSDLGQRGTEIFLQMRLDGQLTDLPGSGNSVTGPFLARGPVLIAQANVRSICNKGGRERVEVFSNLSDSVLHGCAVRSSIDRM
jgi:hypothetical protein